MTTRWTHRVVLAFGLPLVTAGCAAGAGAGRADVAAVVRDADRARAGVLHEIAAQLGLGGVRGSRSFAVCGDDLAPRGVVLEDFVHLDSSGELAPPEATAAAVGLLRDDGWRVADPAGPLLTATRGALVLHLVLGAALVQVDLSTRCVATSRAVAEAYADRPVEDLPWPS
ncbi:hypothetical protein [Nocardioides nitrophenolicus]|uniref:hypothetical protein n=1 Tax=Nocardioides nitrophenolicus TaxID=60489 RepID=UPI00195CE659|nr:hypothetical protein [Nocardioides nitrophenolicus]MBM7516123.1 hypothetical protein [Nocardioides nitrophenolicus]